MCNFTLKYLPRLYRVGQEDKKKLSDFQTNTIKQKMFDFKNSFNNPLYNTDHDTIHLKPKSKGISYSVQRIYIRLNFPRNIYFIKK